MRKKAMLTVKKPGSIKRSQLQDKHNDIFKHPYRLHSTFKWQYIHMLNQINSINKDLEILVQRLKDGYDDI